MAKKRKSPYMTFLTDSDGMTGKDYLLVISTGVFFLFVSAGLVAVMFGYSFGGMYLDLLQMTVPVVMTVVGGVMGVQAVESFRKPLENNDEETSEGDDTI